MSVILPMVPVPVAAVLVVWSVCVKEDIKANCSVGRLKLLSETQTCVWTELLVNIVQVTGAARARKGHFALVIRMYH